MVKIKKHLVSKSVAKDVTYNGKNSKKYIVIHETANTSKGANADAHARLQANGNSRQASWHYQVDDKEIIQSFGDDTQCWHAGNRKYNEQSIGVEICVNSDGDFKKAVDNAVKLTKHLMDKYNINANNVIQHNQASGKDCPRYLRSGDKGVSWSDFKAKIGGESSSTDKSTNKKSISQMASEVIAGKHGNGHAARRKSLGISQSEYEKVREEVNRRLGITPKPSKPKKSISQMAKEVIDGKHGNGHENRRNSLGISKSLYAKVRAEVNKRLGGGGSPKRSISQMAEEIIAGKHGNGHEQRRKSLGIDKATYKKVRAKVNEKLGAKTSKKSSSKKTLKKGQTVTLKKSAKKFATGETIAGFAKGKKYKILQVKSDRVLLDEIMSWVKKSDVQ